MAVRDQQVLMQDYQVPSDVLWTAVKRALTTVDGITLEQADDVQKTALFKTGVTWTSWGQNMIASVEPLGADAVRLHITGQIRNTFLSSNWGEELHEKGFVRGLTDALDRFLTQH
jgi:hypothetical protein